MHYKSNTWDLCTGGGEESLMKLSLITFAILLLSNQNMILYELTQNKVYGFATVLFTLLAAALCITQIVLFIK